MYAWTTNVNLFMVLQSLFGGIHGLLEGSWVELENRYCRGLKSDQCSGPVFLVGIYYHIPHTYLK